MFRGALMDRHNEGLTKTRNRFHDPHETSPDILMICHSSHAMLPESVTCLIDQLSLLKSERT